MAITLLRRITELLVMPPTSLFIGVALGLILAAISNVTWKRRAALALSVTSGLALFLLTVPYVSFFLVDSLQTGAPAISTTDSTIDAEAIVVLAADVDCDPPEYGGDQPGALSLQRCRYGARLAKRTGLPLLITGGVLRPDRRPVSHVLRDFVQDELGVAVRWTEDRAVDTRGNAVGSARILEEAGIERVALVTHAWHMPRATRAFERAGLRVLGAPTLPATPPDTVLRGVTPRGKALRDSCWAIHEWLGRAWYRVTATT